MRLVPFGTTDLTVSEVGFGGSRIGGVFAGKASSSDAVRILRQALDSGITFYDTADMYAQGESESLIGTAFRGRRQEVILASKAGFRLPARRNLIKRIKPLVRPLLRALNLKRTQLPAGISGALSQDFSPRYLERALEASLKRLNTEYLDLYQLHSPDAAFMQTDAFGDALQTLEKMRGQGKLRYYGIATEVPEDAKFCLSAPGISSIQLGFGLLDLEALDHGTLEVAESRGLAIIARGCFGGGLLKDGLDETRLKELTPKWERILSLRAHTQRQGRSLPEVALQFCRGTRGVSVTLLGMHSDRNLRESLEYLTGDALGAIEYQALRSLR